jgi:transglutaminase-like putative cysteine protease
VTFRKAALAGLPLLALYCVGSGLNSSGQGGLPWFWFLLVATGYLALLFADGRDRLSRWGRVFRGAGATDSRGGLPTGGARIGVLALVCATVLGAALPASDGLNLLNGNLGGGGDGNGHGPSINALNPVVSLAAGLRNPNNQPLVRYHGTDAALRYAYLRITALDDFDGVEWKPSNEDLKPLPQGTFPAPDGLDPSVDAPQMTTQIDLDPSLSTQWLPAPYPISGIRLGSGDWRYEPQTRSVIVGTGQPVGGVSYSVTTYNVSPTPDQLRQAGPAPSDIESRYTKLPANMPSTVRDTAQQVTAGKTTAYDEALALQTWFTTTGGFTYNTQVDPGTGLDAITKFLEDKQGFCVHFAATMAAMARSLGIPARVAVGFAPGDDLGEDTYQVGTRNYHAWPELYFSGIGWLRFEPTPSVGVAPDYASSRTAPVPSAAPSQATDRPSAQSGPTGPAPSGCPAELRKQGGCGNQQSAAPAASSASGGGASWQLPAALGAVALVVLLLLSPMLWRSRLRRRRLGGGRRLPGGPGGGELSEAQVLAAWQELIDTAWDLGVPPDDALSPRHTARRISETGRLDGPGSAAAGRVALAAERVLYARDPGPSPALAGDVRTAGNGLRAAAGRGQRVRAVLLPPSAARVLWRVGDRNRALRDGLRERLARLGARTAGRLGRLRRRR